VKWPNLSSRFSVDYALFATGGKIFDATRTNLLLLANERNRVLEYRTVP
jgi:hypothetical protein